MIPCPCQEINTIFFYNPKKNPKPASGKILVVPWVARKVTFDIVTLRCGPLGP